MLDTSCYNKNPTESKFLSRVENLKLKGYTLIKTKDNFFIWKKGKKSEYIRLTLMQNYQIKCFFWDLELSFKPFAYKHNHRENAHIKSECFNSDELNKFYNYFLNMLDRIKQNG